LQSEHSSVLFVAAGEWLLVRLQCFFTKRFNLMVQSSAKDKFCFLLVTSVAMNRLPMGKL